MISENTPYNPLNTSIIASVFNCVGEHYNHTYNNCITRRKLGNDIIYWNEFDLQLEQHREFIFTHDVLSKHISEDDVSAFISASKDFDPNKTSIRKDTFISDTFASNVLIIDCDAGKPGSLNAHYKYFKELGLCFAMCPSKSHNKDKKGVVAERFHIFLPTYATLDQAEYRALQTDLFLYQYAKMQDFYTDPDKAIDPSFAKSLSQSISGIPQRQYQEYLKNGLIYFNLGTLNIDKFLKDPDVLALINAEADNHLADIKVTQRNINAFYAKDENKTTSKKFVYIRGTKADDLMDVDTTSSSSEFTPLRQTNSFTPTGVSQVPSLLDTSIDYSPDTLKLALNQIPVALFNKNDSKSIDFLNYCNNQSRYQNNPHIYADVTDIYLSLIAGVKSAGLSNKDIHEWAEQDPMYRDPASHQSRESNLNSYGNCDPSKFYKIYNMAMSFGDHENLLTDDRKKFDHIVSAYNHYTSLGFKTFKGISLEQRNNNKYKAKKGAERELTEVEIMSLIDAMSKDGYTIYKDTKSDSPSISLSGKTISYDDFLAFLSKVIKSDLGYSATKDSISNAMRLYLAGHEDNSFRLYCASKGISADKWDGKSRVKHLFTKYLRVPNNIIQTKEYLEQLSLYMFTSIIGLNLHVTQDQYKVDDKYSKSEILPILCSQKGGIGKNKLMNILALSPDFKVGLSEDQLLKNDKRDIALVCKRASICELEDLNFKRQGASFQERLKATLSAQSFSYQVKFQMDSATVKRQFFYIASTNNLRFINSLDYAVARRLAPITFTKDFQNRLDLVKRDIEQIYCEAMHLYKTQGIIYQWLDNYLKSMKLANAHSRYEDIKNVVHDTLHRMELNTRYQIVRVRVIDVIRALDDDRDGIKEIKLVREHKEISDIILNVLLERGYTRTSLKKVDGFRGVWYQAEKENLKHYEDVTDTPIYDDISDNYPEVDDVDDVDNTTPDITPADVLPAEDVQSVSPANVVQPLVSPTDVSSFNVATSSYSDDTSSGTYTDDVHNADVIPAYPAYPNYITPADVSDVNAYPAYNTPADIVPGAIPDNAVAGDLPSLSGGNVQTFSLTPQDNNNPQFLMETRSLEQKYLR